MEKSVIIQSILILYQMKCIKNWPLRLTEEILWSTLIFDKDIRHLWTNSPSILHANRTSYLYKLSVEMFSYCAFQINFVHSSTLSHRFYTITKENKLRQTISRGLLQSKTAKHVDKATCSLKRWLWFLYHGEVGRWNQCCNKKDPCADQVFSSKVLQQGLKHRFTW